MSAYLAGDCAYWHPAHPYRPGCGVYFCDREPTRRPLKEIIFERNKRIDVAAAAPSDPIDILALEEQIRVQCHLADTEVVNSYCLFEQMIIIGNKLKAVALTYPKKPGPRLVPLFPAPLKGILDQLRALCETVVPNMQPHETEASLED